MQDKSQLQKKLTIKDIITAALLGLCGLLIYVLFSSFLSLTPYTLLILSPVYALFAGITFDLAILRTQKPIGIAIYIMIISSMAFYVPQIIAGVLASVLCVLLLSGGRYTNKKILTLCYCIHQCFFAIAGMYIPFIFFTKQTISQYGDSFGADYMTNIGKLISPLSCVILLAVTIAASIIGSAIASKILKKHFVKAGMVQ